ncbi:MAG: hypothetical protein ACI9OJ_005287 [Myxococcota bacterium]
MKRALPFFSAVLLLLASTASAQSPDQGTRLILQDDDGPVVLNINGELAEPDEPEGVSLGVRARYVTVPDAIFDSIFLEHTSLNSYSIGLEVGIDGPGGSRVIFGLDYTDLSMPHGNFRNGDSAFSSSADPPNQANYTEIDLHMIALDVTFLWHLEITRYLGFVYGVGLGIAYTPGSIHLTDVFPDCESPVEQCGHWRDVTRREAELPTPVWPLLTMQAGFYVDPTPGLRIRFEGGFRGVLFAGTSIRTTF